MKRLIEIISGGDIKQTIIDTLVVVAAVLVFGFFVWLIEPTDPMNYRIERQRPEPKYVRI